jgi:hypothetical protein
MVFLVMLSEYPKEKINTSRYAKNMIKDIIIGNELKYLMVNKDINEGIKRRILKVKNFFKSFSGYFNPSEKISLKCIALSSYIKYN